MTDAPDWVTLTDGESVVWSGRRTLWAYADRLLLAAVAAVAGVALPLASPLRVDPVTVTVATVPSALGGLGVAVVLVGWALLGRASVRYLVTDEEVYVKRGLLSRTVRNLRLEQVQNTSFSQSLLGRVLSYGDVRFDTAGGGGSEVTFRAVPDPRTVLATVTRQQDDLVTGS